MAATTVHQVSEKELSQYAEYVISKFNFLSYKVRSYISILQACHAKIGPGPGPILAETGPPDQFWLLKLVPLAKNSLPCKTKGLYPAHAWILII